MISIHAPGWGATWREDQLVVWEDISIHAPGWGATVTFSLVKSSIAHFNPRTRVGCDSVSPCNVLCIPSFQSTHPGGVRHTCRS